MGIPGSYLLVKCNGAIIAESTDVNLKVIVSKLDGTHQGSGVNAVYVPGSVKIGIAGSFLYASDGTNWATLYDYLAAGSEFEIVFYRDGTEFFGGGGILKKLSMKGSNAKEGITGSYGIRYTPTTGAILTESGLEITTEDGQVLIIE